MTRVFATLAIAFVAMVPQAVAQERPGAGGRGGAGGQAAPSPVFAAIDENSDGEISSSELENAVDSLKSLDRDSDGKLSADELRPRGPGRPEESPDSPGPDAGGGRPERGGPGGGDMMARLMQADQNGDGKISKEEAPERIQANFERVDGNGDGMLDEQELKQMAERRREGGQAGPGGPGGPPNARGQGPGGPGGPGGGGGSPEAFIERIFQFDSNGDGNLTREELAKAAEQMGAGRRGGDRPEGSDSNSRPRRPQRPNDNN